jgi:hypothetical protein
MIGKRPAKGNPVCRESSIEAIIYCLHLHIISENPLSRVAVVGSRREKSQQHLMAECNTLIHALCQMRREDWDVIRRHTVKGVKENSDCSVTCYGD